MIFWVKSKKEGIVAKRKFCMLEMKKRRIWKLRLSCQGCLGIPGGLWTPQENFYYPNADKTPPGGELVRIE